MLPSLQDLKCLVRSKSLRFTLDHRQTNPHVPISSFSWKGRKIYYRPGTSDTMVLYRMLLKPGAKSEYRIPDGLNPKIILDIGGHIGASSVLLADRFPSAQIFTFEPVPSNFALLEKNAKAFPNIRVFPVALGSSDGEKSIFFSDNPTNTGGFSFFQAGSNPKETVKVTTKEINGFLENLGIRKVDLIKIDTEGSEYAILKALSPELLSGAQWLMGELHGEQDFELLSYLSRWFDIELKKDLRSRLSIFYAAKKP